MKDKDASRFVLGICGGIIFGAIIENMAIGLMLGFLVAAGVITWKRKQP